jgi:hypothetical protein
VSASSISMIMRELLLSHEASRCFPFAYILLLLKLLNGTSNPGVASKGINETRMVSCGGVSGLLKD